MLWIEVSTTASMSCAAMWVRSRDSRRFISATLKVGFIFGPFFSVIRLGISMAWLRV